MKKTTGIVARTTSERLASGLAAGSGVSLNYGSKLLVAQYSYDGKAANGYKAAVYEYTTEDHTYEGKIKLVAESED